MTTNEQGPVLLIRPSNKDKRVIARAAELFQGFHLPASAPPYLATLVRESNKPHVIDPQAYLFRLSPKQLIDPKKERVRPGITALAKRYGPPFEDVAGVRKLDPDDFADEGVCQAVAERVAGFQRRKCRAGQLALDLDPYYEKYKLWDESDPVPKAVDDPVVLVPPFFYFTSPDDPWLEINLKLARGALQARGAGERVVPALLFRAGLLTNRDAITKIVRRWASEPFDGYLIWPNNFIEEKAGSKSLSGLMHLVGELAATGRPVDKLFGGFFSALLWSRGLRGFSSGLGTASSRNAFAFGGAGPRKTAVHRYYIPGLHRSYGLEDANAILNDNPRLRCGCEVCREAYGRSFKHFGAMAEKGMCQTHFLLARSAEIQHLSNGGAADVVGDMRTTLREMERRGETGYGFLGAWASLAS